MNYGNLSFRRVLRMAVVPTSLIILLSPTALFAYQAAPIAQTTAATYITEKSAVLHGTVSANDMLDTLQWFEWGMNGQSGDAYVTPAVAIRGQGVNTSASIVGLAPGTQYFYRQISENSRGKYVGNTMYFTTKPLPTTINPIVVVETTPPFSITENSAILRGYVSPHGSRISRWWFEWGTTNALEHQTAPAQTGTNSHVVETSIRKLTPGTVYFYRLVGDNGEGRVIGTTRVFVTLGTPPPPSEAPRAQTVPVVQEGNDHVTRNTTDTDSAAANIQKNPFESGLPGDFLGNFLRGKKNADTANASGSEAATPEVKGATAPGPLARLFSAFSSGEKGVMVTIEKIGPSKVPAHTPVEYKVAYAYRLSEPVKDARLKITLSPDVVYIGDNTTNELLLEEGSGQERTYVLPIARLEKGSTRTISILGMTTGDAAGFPDAYARIEFVGANGQLQVIAAGGGTIDENTKAEKPKNGDQVAATGRGILPSSLVGWLLYIAFVAGIIFVVRKARAYYERRKEELAEEAQGPKPEQDTTKWLDELRAHKNTLPT